MDDRRILDHFPLPIARGYRRYRNAAEVRERHDAAYYLFEIYLKYVASVAIAHYLSGDARDHRVNAVLKGLARPSLGEWLRFLRECLKFLSQGDGTDAAVQAMASLFESREARWPAVVKLFNAMRSFRTGSTSEKEQVSLEVLLGEAVAYRNRVLGHGANLESEHYQSFTELLASAFGEVLEKSPFLTVRRLVSFDSIQVEAGSRAECGLIEFMGENPDRQDKPLVLSLTDSLPSKDRLYLLSEDGRFISLYPLVVAHREDVYILNEAKGTPEYLSYSTGERHRPSDLGENQGELFERILGYRVDEARLTQIGDEIGQAAGEFAAELKEGERRLGDYRILREIGRGGMGTVFEAIQESLGRRVALKVLPGTFALDPKRVERFRREARSTARIHHPNIVPVYEVGEAESNHYYSMEHIDGPSLDHVISEARETSERKSGKKDSSTSDPAYISSVVERVAELAEGLEEAHKLGLIHRDVKPSNILVDRSHRYVLVDFGLVHEETAQTITRSGEMIGTLSYMSPEQVSRRRVDARSDVYSLGVSLYEVLTLRTPFEAESDHEIQNSILFKEPVSPRGLNSRVNPDLETIVLHALEKDPARRYQSAGEFAADLRRLLRLEPVRARRQSAVLRLSRRLWRHRGKAGAVAVLLIVSLCALLIWHYWPAKRLELIDQRQLSFDAGVSTDPTLSPDGRMVAYASDRAINKNLDIWIRSVEGGDPVRLTEHEADDKEPAFSPDGEWIAFRSERDGGGIYIVSAEGGEEKLLAPGGRRPRVSPDGTRVAYWVGAVGGAGSDSAVYLCTVDGEGRQQLVPDFDGAKFPVWSPDGESVLLWGWGPNNDWWVVSVDGGSTTRTKLYRALRKRGIPRSDISFRSVRPEVWVEEKHLVLFSAVYGTSENLWAVSISPETGKMEGDLQRLTTGTARELTPWGVEGGRMVFASVHSNVDVWSLPLDARRGMVTGELQRLTRHPALDAGAAISSDGTRLVFASMRAGNSDVWLLDLDGGREPIPLTTTPTREYRPAFHPEGSKVAYESQDTDEFHIREISTSSAPGPAKVFQRNGGFHPIGWSMDGRFLIYHRSEGNPRHSCIMLLEVATGERILVASDPEYNLWGGQFSPDDRWIVVNSTGTTDPGRSWLFILEFKRGTVSSRKDWIEVTDGKGWDDKPRWSPDGNLLYFTSDRDGFRCLWAQRVDPDSKMPVGDAFEVHPFHDPSLSMLNVGLNPLEISVSRDRIVFSLEERSGNIWVAQLGER